MVSLWITIGLVIATLCVSTLGAAFSVLGLGALFSGAVLAVWGMAASLELAKFVLAAYIHQRWLELNIVFKSYLVFAIVVLSVITSMGIFGFLSDAYQSASSAIDVENIKFDTQKTQQNNNKAEIARLNRSIDEIPVSRISKRIKARSEIEPVINELNKKNEIIDQEISVLNLRMLEIKKKVGPLIYIARVFSMDIDSVVKYLILVLVSVFDPLAICLVISMSQAIQSRSRKNQQTSAEPAAAVAAAVPTPMSAPIPMPTSLPTPTVAAANTPSQILASVASAHDDEIIQMRFADETTDKKAL